MKNNNREKDIKRMFDQHQPALNTDKIWDAIEPKLKKKKKRRFFIFWLLGGGLVLLSGLLYYYTSPNISPELQGSKISETSVENQNTSATKEEEKEFSTIANQDEFLSENNTEQAEYQASLLATKTLPKPLSTKTSKNRPTINTIYEKAKPEAFSSVEKSINDKYASQSPSENETINSKTPLQSKNGTLNKPIDNTISDTNNPNKEEKELLTKDVLGKASAPLPEEKDVDKKQLSEKEKEEKAEEKEKRKKIKPLRNSEWEIQLQTALSPVLAYKNLKSNQKADSFAPAYLEKRRKSEKQLEAFAYNIGLHFQHKRTGLTLLSAIEYRQFNERFEFSSFEVTTDIKTGTLSVTEDAAGNIINTTRGPKLVTTTTTREQKFNNRHHFISIPIGIGRIWLNKKSAWKAMGGFEYNLLYTFKGTIYTNSENLTDFQRGKDKDYYNSIFKTSRGFNLWISGEYSRSINPRLSWLVAPKLQVPLSSTMQSDFQLKQNFFALQFDLGLNYLLNPKKKTKKESGRKGN